MKRAGIAPIIIIVFAALGLSACSPSALFGSGADGKVQALPSYRRVNTGCSQLDLSRSTLDVPAARKLISCLNSGGALGGFAKLTDAMSDEQMSPFVESLNRTVLNNPRTLFELERSFQDLVARGTLSATLGGLGELFKNDELITRTFKLFQTSFATQGRVDPEFLLILEHASTALTQTRLEQSLDLALSFTKARAFTSLWSRIASSSTSAPISEDVAEGLVQYLRSPSRLGRDIVEQAISGTLFKLTGLLLPEDAEGIRSKMPAWASLLNISLSDRASIAGRIGGLFEALKKPIPCMQSARSMNHVAEDVLRELSQLSASQARSFIERDKLIELLLTSPLCEFPAEIAQNYLGLQSLAATPAVEPMAELVRAIYETQNQGLLIRTLEDPAFRLLLPALSELQARTGLEDSLLLASAVQWEHSQITEFLKFWVKPLTGDGSPRSAYDVLNEGFARLNAKDLQSWLHSFAQTDSGLASTLRIVRSAYYINDTHPLTDLLRSTLTESKQDPRLLEALLRLSALPEFQNAIHELSLMARPDDGRLKDLLQTTLELFHRYAAHGEFSVTTRTPEQADPALQFRTRHDWAASDLAVLVEQANITQDFGACEKIDLSVHWDDSSSPRFESQLEVVSACVNGDGKYTELSDSLKLLTRTKLESNTEGTSAQTLHSLLAQTYHSIQFSRAETAVLTNWILSSVSDGRVLRALNAIPIWVEHSVVRPLIDLAAPLVTDLKVRNALRRLGLYGATVLKRDDVQSVVAYIDDLLHAEPKPSFIITKPSYDQKRILRWIGNKECSLAAPTESRSAQIIDEYENSVVAHGPLQNGKLKQSWSTPDLRAELDPIFSKFGKLKENGPVVRALLQFASRFNDPTQYPAGFLEAWLRKRASDRRLISYLYPGETLPRVRLVNGLDRLSIILLNADIYAPDPVAMNFGMQFLANISEAWGDVPFESRPAPIQAKFPKNGHKKCPTLAEAIANIRDTAQAIIDLVGVPVFPVCQQTADPADPIDVQQKETNEPKSAAPPNPDATPGSELATLQASLYNIAQTVDVLQENVDDGGILVLRDLFFDLYYTGPARNRDSNAGLKNNLGVVTRLVKVGILRQPGLLVLSSAANDPLAAQFFQSFLSGAASPAAGAVMDAIFGADPQQALIWKVFNEILALHNPAEISRAKSLGYYGLISLGQLGLLDVGLKSLQPILAQNYTFLVRHAELIGSLLRSKAVSEFTRSLAESVNSQKSSLGAVVTDALSDPAQFPDALALLGALDESPQAHQSWQNFLTNWNAVSTLPEYRALRLPEIGRSLLNLMEARDSQGNPLPPDQNAVTRKILCNLSTELERNQMQLVDQLMVFAKNDPDGFYRLIESLSRLIENGEVPHLLELVQKYLGPPA